jgi:hypothetical protein
MPASRLLRAAPAVAAAFLWLAMPSSGVAQRSTAAETRTFHAPPLVSDGLTAPSLELLTGRSGFSPHGQHGPATEHLPAVRENVELVSSLEMSTPAALRTPETADQPVLPGQIADLAVYKNFAYLNSWSEPTCRRGGIFVVDISNPAAPQQVGFLPAAPNTRHGEGAHVITINTPTGPMDVLAVNNEPLPPPCDQALPSAGGIDLWNVTNPRNPVLLALGVGDSSDPTDPPGVPGPVHHAHSTFLWTGHDGRAFAVLTDNDEFGTFDVDILEITNPAAPRLVAEHNLRERFPQIEDNSAYGDVMYHHDVVVKNVGGVLTMLVSYWDAGYVTLNVDDPTAPLYVGDTSFDGRDPLFPDRNPPEGNAHQAEFSHDNRWILGADEDFNPYRFDARITSGPHADFPLTATQGSDVPLVGPGSPLIGDTKFVGEACNVSLPAPAAGVPIALIARGGCTFQEKYDNVVDAGYEAGIVFNSNSTVSGCESLLTMLVSGDEIPFLFIPRNQGFRIMEAYDPATYECTPGDPANTTPNPAAPRDSASVRFVALFDGWGYTHVYENGPGKMRHVGAFAIEESMEEQFAFGFGDLSVHEFATDATENIAYSSYYAGGMRVFTFGPNGLTQTGKFIDEGGNNFWGVEQFTLGNQRYFAGSDRDFGLYIFRYTGPGAAQPPVCADQHVTVPYQTPVTLSLRCTDPNGNPLTLAIASNPTNGSLSAIDQGADTVTYTPNAGYSGPDSFMFTASDGAATSAAATVRITVGPNPLGCRNLIEGTSRRDIIAGTDISDRIRAGSGDDVVDARAGDDCLFGQKHHDVMDAENGNDVLSGGPGRDKMLGNAGADRLRGGAGMDRLFGGGGNDRLTGRAKRDYLTAGRGNDRLIGGSGRDSLVGDRGNDRMSGKSGNDILRGNQGSDRINGGKGRDLIIAARGRDRVNVADGRIDHVSCGSGRDRATADRFDRLTNCERVRLR